MSKTITQSFIYKYYYFFITLYIFSEQIFLFYNKKFDLRPIRGVSISFWE